MQSLKSQGRPVFTDMGRSQRYIDLLLSEKRESPNNANVLFTSLETYRKVNIFVSKGKGKFREGNTWESKSVCLCAHKG